MASISRKRKINEKNLLFVVINLNEFIFFPENRSQTEGLVDHRVLEELEHSNTRLLSISLPDSLDRKIQIFIFFITLSFAITIVVEFFKITGLI